MAASLAFTKDKTHCRSCKHVVQMVTLADGSRVAVEPEVMKAVSLPPGWPRSSDSKDVGVVNVRRFHAELCDSYKAARERAGLRREMAAYGKRKGM